MEFSRLTVSRLTTKTWELERSWHTPYGLVPKGFKTDGATVPRFLWWFAAPAGDFFEAAVIHDHLLRQYGHTEYTHKALRDTALHFGVGQFRATVAYWAVIFWGWTRPLRKRG